eukprot:9503733-Pyramimonas_sp.AAC.1
MYKSRRPILQRRWNWQRFRIAWLPASPSTTCAASRAPPCATTSPASASALAPASTRLERHAILVALEVDEHALSVNFDKLRVELARILAIADMLVVALWLQMQKTVDPNGLHEGRRLAQRQEIPPISRRLPRGPPHFRASLTFIVEAQRNHCSLIFLPSRRASASGTWAKVFFGVSRRKVKRKECTALAVNCHDEWLDVNKQHWTNPLRAIVSNVLRSPSLLRWSTHIEAYSVCCDMKSEEVPGKAPHDESSTRRRDKSAGSTPSTP